jgi:Zn-dependent metalloprotease
MSRQCTTNCIVPPHILKKMMESEDRSVRASALSTLLATTRLRAERSLIAQIGFLPSIAGEKRRTIFDCGNVRLLELARLVRGEGQEGGVDRSVDSAYDGLGATYDFFKQEFDRNSLDGRGIRLDAYVHFGRAFNNAFWNGRQMVFGDGDGRIFSDFTGSLDVIAHELTHGVTEFTAGLEYHNQPGALNESISDVFGSLVKQWTLGQSADQADWLIGADIFSPSISGDALRSLKAPGKAYDDPILGRDPQPAHMQNFVQLPDTEEDDFGGVHINSGIPNHAFYLVAKTLAGNAWAAPGHIWYEALRASGPLTDFMEFAAFTHEMAGRLYGTAGAEQQAVFAAWREVGIRIPGAVPVKVARELGWTAGAKEPDTQAALVKQIDGLAREVKTLAREVAHLKTAKAPRAA